MSLPHVLLALLRAAPRTGYELARAMREEMDPSWSAGFSQIYPALARLRRRGWVHLRVLGPRRGPRRLLYRATAAGRRELERWLTEPPPPFRRNDACLARVAFLDVLSSSTRRAVQVALATALSEEIARLEALAPAEGSRALARRASIEQLEALRRFLQRGAPGRPPALVRPKGRPTPRGGRMIRGAREEP